MKRILFGVAASLACAVAAVAYGLFSATWILKLPQGSDRMKQIASAIQEGAGAYMKRQYSIIAVVGVIMFVILLVIVYAAMEGIFVTALYTYAKTGTVPSAFNKDLIQNAFVQK